MLRYAELHCVTNYSFLRGASHPEELIVRAKAEGYEALAITDECSLAGIVRAHVAAKQEKLALIVGSEFTLSEGGRLVILARNRAGYGALCGLITRARTAMPKGNYALALDDLTESLADCFALWIPAEQDGDQILGQALLARFGKRLRIAIELTRDGTDSDRLTYLESLGQHLGIRCLAAGDVHMHVRNRRVLADVLAALRHRTTLALAGAYLHANGERHLRPVKMLADLYPPRLLEETIAIAKQCHFSLDELHYEYPANLVPTKETPASWLAKLTYDGMKKRWPEGIPPKVKAQISHELALIAELRYEPFFLTVHDLVTFARDRGILCQGRGSAANSAVCYALGITEVDPERMEMLFERFVSRERNEPPDIDVDFEHERREEVIQYIYKKYGRDHAALAATVICYRLKSAVRDVGRALGIDRKILDRVAATLVWWDDSKELERQIASIGLKTDAVIVRRWLTVAKALMGFPRHLSQHVGGFVISRGPLTELVPIEPAAMPGRSVIQWDKDDLEALGLLKIDVLALGMLTVLSRTLKLISKRHRSSFTLADIPPEDAETYALIQRADTLGVFQIESRAQMAMLPRLKPRHFYDLVIEVAIVRPGPIQGNMVHPYLRRRAGLDPVTYPSMAVKQVLERTLGVPIFQEQVMRLAVVAAGFSPGEADQLRRAMAAWKKKGSLEPFRKRLLNGMQARGYASDFAENLYRQIHGFADYGFPESHAASFALLVYASAWLKRHEPEAFACSLLNSQPMGFYAPAQIVADARRHGVKVRPVDVNASDWEATLETTGSRFALRLGFCQARGVSMSAAKRIVMARAANPFISVADLAQRARIGRKDLLALARADALATLAGHRHNAHWEAAGARGAGPLFEEVSLRQDRFLEGAPMLRKPTEAETVIADYGSLGLSLAHHPLELLREQLVREGTKRACDINAWPDGEQVCAAGLVINRQRPETASGVIFMTLEDETGFINLVVWPAVAERYRAAAFGGSLLFASGRIQRAEQIVHLVVDKIEDRSELIGTLHINARNFH